MLADSYLVSYLDNLSHYIRMYNAPSINHTQKHNVDFYTFMKDIPQSRNVH